MATVSKKKLTSADNPFELSSFQFLEAPPKETETSKTLAIKQLKADKRNLTDNYYKLLEEHVQLQEQYTTRVPALLKDSHRLQTLLEEKDFFKLQMKSHEQDFHAEKEARDVLTKLLDDCLDKNNALVSKNKRTVQYLQHLIDFMTNDQYDELPRHNDTTSGHRDNHRFYESELQCDGAAAGNVKPLMSIRYQLKRGEPVPRNRDGRKREGEGEKGNEMSRGITELSSTVV